MLKKFEVIGFKNFDFPLVLDFSDVKQYNFNKECIKDGILKTVVVYGKNSVGKSNFGLALFDIVTHLVDRHVTPNLFDYYLNNNGNFNVASFCYTFQFDKDLVVYSYKKTDIDEIKFESLIINEQLVFEFNLLVNNSNNSELKYGYYFRKHFPNLNLETLDARISILRYIVNNSSIEKEHPIRKMYDFVSNMLWFRSLDENRFIGYKDGVKKASDYYDFIFEDNNLQEFSKLLNASGLDKSLVVREQPSSEKQLYFDGEILIPFFRTASNGTKALYTYFYWTRNRDVSLLFIDEFDAYYHFELSEYIVKNLELRNNQTIITTHNTNLLSNSIMRPDSYFVLTSSRMSSIARATERELREGHNLEKLYISGEFNEQ